MTSLKPMYAAKARATDVYDFERAYDESSSRMRMLHPMDDSVYARIAARAE